MATKYRKPVAQGVPATAEPESLFGYMRDTLTIQGDIVAGTGESWHADSCDRDQRVPVVKKRSRVRRSPPNK